MLSRIEALKMSHDNITTRFDTFLVDSESDDRMVGHSDACSAREATDQVTALISGCSAHASMYTSARGMIARTPIYQ